MAVPVRFCGFNKAFHAPAGKEKEIGTLYTHSEGGRNISCWKLDPVEHLRVIETGEVWLENQSGNTMFPQYVSGTPLMQSIDSDTGEPTIYYSDGRHLVDDARRFAILHHGDQKYGEDEPYIVHLDEVVQILRDFGADWPFLVAGYGHDLEEDTMQDIEIEVRRGIIATRFGPMPEAMIWACTGLNYIDGVKQNRKARALQQYVKIKEFPPSAVVKIADRLGNMRKSARTKHSMCKVYVDEVLDFDLNVGVHCPPNMRQALFEAALACLENYRNPAPELVAAINAKKAEIDALVAPSQEAA